MTEKRRFVRPSNHTAGGAGIADVLDTFGKFTTAPADLHTALKDNAGVVMDKSSVESLVRAINESDNDVVEMSAAAIKSGIANIATALVHPSCVRAMARHGLYAYIDEKGKIRRIRGEASEAKPVAVDGEVDTKFFLPQSWLKDLERFVNRGEHVLLIGPAGCGKTEGTEQIFKKRKQQLMIMSCTPSTDSDDVEGKIDLREGSTVFSPSVVTEAVKEGYGLLIDEADAAPAEACFAFYRCLDGKDMRITRQGFDGIIPLHKDFRCVATQNTEGRGDSNGLFHGRSLQDEAFLDRWPAAIRVGYPGQDDEVLILHKRTGCPKSEVIKVVEAANIMRKAMAESSLMFTVSMRRTQAICQNLVYGDSPEKAWLYSCLNRATTEDQTAMREILNKIYGSRFNKRT